ncbi:hypothetical protein DRP43_06320 [candidate division TA06 bacterium]|uniref:Zinc ribbon domain-containing protein n=1 Tax=candidate division TA06 bacterium TaxID=2250710 RepID=A0A660SAD2_UNCT6|nr:MAG: hypothetical protein DRP43_06320 [candidate division TA06 bacterium]
MWFIIFPLIFALLCLYIAEKKGRDKWLGFLLGFLFGIFALIGYLIVKKVKKCPACGQKIPFEAKICPYCETLLKTSK